MSFINNNMKWIMLVSGVITFTMISAAFAPQLALSSMFGSSLEGALAEVIVRQFGVAVALVGGMLIYGAFNPDVRPLVLIVASIGKLAFVTLVVVYGFAQQLMHVVIMDGSMVLIFILYLTTREQ